MNWKGTIAEFMRAALKGDSYTPRRNPYLFYGFLWGLPIPLLSLLLGWRAADLPISLRSLPALLGEQPWQLFFLLHPLIFGAIFGILGTLYTGKEREVNRLLEDLRAKVRELNAANQDLRVLDKMKDEFLSNVTHELKTPLVTIQGYNEMLRSHRLGDLTDKQTKALEVMNRNQSRLKELIEQLLRYGRLEEKGAQVFQTAFSLRKMMIHLKQNFLPAMEAKEIHFEVIPPTEDIHVLGQEDLIEQVFVNLLSNARKFTDKGGRVRFYVDSSKDPRQVSLIVDDNGCGVSEDAVPFVFRRFWQGDGSIRRKHGGTGLGLAIVKKILDAHRAPIAVESRLGEGTRFTVTLPLAYSGQPGPAA